MADIHYQHCRHCPDDCCLEHDEPCPRQRCDGRQQDKKPDDACTCGVLPHDCPHHAVPGVVCAPAVEPEQPTCDCDHNHKGGYHHPTCRMAKRMARVLADNDPDEFVAGKTTTPTLADYRRKVGEGWALDLNDFDTVLELERARIVGIIEDAKAVAEQAKQEAYFAGPDYCEASAQVHTCNALLAAIREDRPTPWVTPGEDYPTGGDDA